MTTQPATTPLRNDRDVGSIDLSTLTIKPWPAARTHRAGGFQIVIKQSVLNDIRRHGRSSNHEICGVLVGDVFLDDHGPYLYIQSSLRGNFASAKTTAVTFTAETWTDIQQTMEQRHPEKKILGWYHTHPNFGIFLSDMDLFIHENFFGLPWQVALVFDPVREERGIFVWRNNKTVLSEAVVELDVPPDVEAVRPPAEELSPTEELALRMHRAEQRHRWTVAWITLLFFFALVWPIVLIQLWPMLRYVHFNFSPPATSALQSSR
jgi:proteasome lid subunit RPN8/RPN11